MSEESTTEVTAEPFQAITSQEELDRALGKRLERERAKFADYGDLKKKAAEFDKFRAENQSEAERAIAEAEERGRTAAASTFGQRLARTQFDAIAGRRNPDYDASKALEFVDLGKFLGDDGEPDTAAITAAVERLVPAPDKKAPSFDGGTRTAPKAGGMNDLIRKAAGHG